MFTNKQRELIQHPKISIEKIKDELKRIYQLCIIIMTIMYGKKTKN